MVVVAADNLTPYRSRFLEQLLEAHGLSGRVCGLPLDAETVSLCQEQDALLITLGSKAHQAARRLLRRCPRLRYLAFPHEVAKLIGASANLDLVVRQEAQPRRQQLIQAVKEQVQQVKQAPALFVSMPPEVFLGRPDELESWLSTNQAPVMVCQLSPQVEIGIYVGEPQGKYPIEMTLEELRNMAVLNLYLDARLIAVKDRFGVRHPFDQT